MLNLLRAGKPLRQVRSVVERSFGNYLGGRARRGQTRELRRLKEQADALREQIEAGTSSVEPEAWARYLKLDGRLKEERRLLKIIARQTEDTLAEVARAAVREALELGEMPVYVSIEMGDVAGYAPPPSPPPPPPPPSPTVGLMPDGSWSMSPAARLEEGEERAATADTIDETFDADMETDADEDSDGDGDDVPGTSAPRGRTITVAIVEAYRPPPFDNAGQNPFPLGEFIGLAANGTWHRFAASRVRRVAPLSGTGADWLGVAELAPADQSEAAVASDDVQHQPDVGEAESAAVDWSPGPCPVPNSLRWQRTGDGLWTAPGTERAAIAAGSIPADADADVAVDVTDPDAQQVDDAVRFLDDQRTRIAGTRREIAEMKSFSYLRRAVKLAARQTSKLKKLEERIARVETRVGEYVAAGWPEFIRVVDILVEEGALVDPISDEALQEEEEYAEAAAEEKAAKKLAAAAGASAGSAANDISEWESDDPAPFGPSGRFSLERLEDLSEYGDAASMFGGGNGGDGERSSYDAAAERARRQARRRLRWDEAEGGSERMDETLALSPLGQACATLRGENELWLGIALSSPALKGLDAQQVAGVAGALCCDSNRPVSCDYGPSPSLARTLEDLEPEAAEVMSLQFEAAMDSPVNLSRSVAALVESWATGSTWDQVRSDTNLEEGDIARVFRRTAELLAQMARTRELPEYTRTSARAAAKLVLRPPITDLS